MRTNWSLAVFLVSGLISSSALLYTAIKMYYNTSTTRKPASALLTTIAGAACVTIIAFKVNNPANLINVLGKPTAGLSSAVLSQMALAVAGLIVYLKNMRGKFVSVILACLFILAVFCLNRLYMISTRSALDTILLTLVFASVSFFTAESFLAKTNEKISVDTLGISILSAVVIIYFFIRIAYLTPPDRVLSIEMLVSGCLAPVFWGFILLGVIIPVASAIISFLEIYTMPPVILGISAVVAIVLLSIIINEMPAHLDAIQGRMLF